MPYYVLNLAYAVDVDRYIFPTYTYTGNAHLTTRTRLSERTLAH